LLSNPVYNFSFTNGDDPARFLLHFVTPFTGISQLQSNQNMQVYSVGHEVYLNDHSTHPAKGELILYNMMGQEIAREKVTATALNKFYFNISNGWYVVRVVTAGSTFNGKIYIN